MTDKLLSKEEIRNAILKIYDNDPRITDELLFEGNKLTMQGYILLESLYPRASRHHYRGNGRSFLDGIAYHCYLVFDFDKDDDERKGFDQRKADKIKPVIQKIYEKLDKMIGQSDGCYFISDCVAGCRDNGDHDGNLYSGWQTITQVMVDIWIFSKEATFMEFLDDNKSKCTMLLENQ